MLRKSQVAVETSQYVDFTQGSLVHTGRALDLAINGEGFFVIESPEGEKYTRNGAFRPNVNGQLVNGLGELLAGENGPVTLPPNAGEGNINVDQQGNIRVNGLQVGKVRVVTFENAGALVPVGGVLLRLLTTLTPTTPKTTPSYRATRNLLTSAWLKNWLV